ncbi:hypothetical protein MRX96_021993 [Rhipicephalus microplus]
MDLKNSRKVPAQLDFRSRAKISPLLLQPEQTPTASPENYGAESEGFCTREDAHPGEAASFAASEVLLERPDEGCRTGYPGAPKASLFVHTKIRLASKYLGAKRKKSRQEPYGTHQLCVNIISKRIAYCAITFMWSNGMEVRIPRGKPVFSSRCHSYAVASVPSLPLRYNPATENGKEETCTFNSTSRKEAAPGRQKR